MSETDQPQIYLLTPTQFSLSEYPPLLGRVLDSAPVACLRLTITSTVEDDVIRAADALRDVAHSRDVPLVIDRHLNLVKRLGLDGVHLTDGAKTVRYARKELGADAIVGAHCGVSQHEGMNAGEAGADYITFGPAGETLLGSAESASDDLFKWWSETIELPVVAEGALTVDVIRRLRHMTDFFAIGDEIWSSDDPVAQLDAFRQIMSEI